MSNESENSKAFEEMMQEHPTGVYALAEGMTAEEMRAVFFNVDALVGQPEMVYRLNGGKHRYYYTFDEAQNPVFFTSVTTMIKFTMPTSPHLIKWIAEKGYEEARNYAQERADYGTFMHTEIAELLINKTYDTTKVREKLKAFIEQEKLPVDFINHEEEIKKDVLSFAQFMIDCKVNPLAIEIVLTHPTDGYAGAIDLICEMTIKVDGLDHDNPYKSGARKGQPREVKVDKTLIAIVDFKSGRKGFYEEHEVQLQAYTEMWQHHFPNKKVERLYNWSPKDWRGAKPTYNLKDQTEAKSRGKLKHLVELARIESSRKETNVTIIEGTINLDTGLEDNLKEMSLAELVKKRKSDKDKPTK